MHLSKYKYILNQIVRNEFSGFSSAFSVIFCLIFLSALSQHSHAEGKIVKWKDANGVTHYGDKLPVTEAGRGNSLLNKQGTVVQTNEPFSAKADSVVAEKQSEEQLRQDSALLASYLSAEEVDLAMERNIKGDQLTIDVLRQQQNNAQVNLNNIDAKIKAKYANKPVPPALTEQAAYYEAQVLKKKTEIANIESNIEKTKSRFAEYKKRYLELRPREHVLTDIKVSSRSLAELEAWKAEATGRLESLQQQALSYQRRAASIPNNLVGQIQSTSDEIARADKEIALAKSNLSKSQQTFTK